MAKDVSIDIKVDSKGAETNLKSLEGKVNKTTKSLKDLRDEQEKLNEEFENASKSADPKRYKELQNQLRSLDGQIRSTEDSLVGMSNTDIASNVSELTGGIGDMTAAFVLLGSEGSESMEAVAKNVETAIGISMGVAGVVDVFKSMRKIMSSLNVVTLAQTVATKIATAAQWAWNVAMTANPIGLIIAGVAGLVAGIAYLVGGIDGLITVGKYLLAGVFLPIIASVKLISWLFGDSGDKAEESGKKQRKSMKDNEKAAKKQSEVMQGAEKAIQDSREKSIQQIELEMEMQRRRADLSKQLSEEIIRSMELEGASNEEIYNAKRNLIIQSSKDDKKARELEREEAKKSLVLKLQELAVAVLSGEADKEKIRNLRKEIKLLEDKSSFWNIVMEEGEKTLELQNDLKELDNEITDGLKNQANEAKRAADERRRIAEEGDKFLRELEIDRMSDYEASLADVNDAEKERLDEAERLYKEGAKKVGDIWVGGAISYEEYTQAKLDIDAEYNEKRNELEEEHKRKVAETNATIIQLSEELRLEKAELDESLLEQRISNQQEDLKREEATLKKQMDFLKENEAERIASEQNITDRKLMELQRRTDAELAALDTEAAGIDPNSEEGAAELERIEAEKNAIRARAKQEEIQINADGEQAIREEKTRTFEAEKEYLEKIKELQNNVIESAINGFASISQSVEASMNGSFEEINSSFANLQSSVLKISEDIFALIEENGKLTAAEITQVALAAVQMAVTAIDSILTAQNEKETEDRERLYEQESESLKKSLDNRQISQKAYDAKMEMLNEKKEQAELSAKRKAFKQNKAMQITNAVIQTAQAVIAAYSSAAAVPIAGIAMGPIMAGVAGALGAAQIGIIASQKFKAARGGIVPGNGPSNIDSVDALLAPGETVINAESSKMFAPQLDAINRAGGGVSLMPQSVEPESNNSNTQTAFVENKRNEQTEVRAYIVESDVSNSLNRQSRFDRRNEYS